MFRDPSPARERHIIAHASGNVTNDGVSGVFTYDAENRIKTIGGDPSGYVYDGAGLKIKSSSTLYIYAGAKVIAEYPAASTTPESPTKEYVYSGSQLLVTLTGASVKYSYPDHLSTRAEADASGNVLLKTGHLPFGDPWYDSTANTTSLKFTSYDRDSGTGLDYAIFRNMNWRQGKVYDARQARGECGRPAEPEPVCVHAE
jgi:hypothetical protein